MKFEKTLTHGILKRRYKRFLADIVLDHGEEVVAHCTNSGSMKSCLEEGAEVYLSPVDDPSRKTKYTWEMIKINEKWVGINTSNPNVLAYEAIVNGQIPGFRQYTSVKREVTFDDSRFDIFAENGDEKCYIEVKNVTYKEGDYALFPDAVTTRGLKHLHTLAKVKEAGYRAVMLYIIQRTDINYFDTANEIDPAYSEALIEAVKNGVEVMAIKVHVTPESLQIGDRVRWEPRKKD
ncbi:MAG: DNA/RNA nuclease SfsA [Bacteroidales bacterium]|nr:DNA/RNA nuclease SfsA [Bacteroidales bacterium]MDD2322100.1 DNA/RNA nuclease SfsA [Bacteroidales bacterium]MDD3010528.1 DNA/RNA nuclease SfsA [Bacteroidales bacterium]MDD3961177.1 DNA/RNA nuclease SfsA [Bacteroidales bacterium]MDY0285469.1 DNA/RNA nuclease SfsA [Bacteroidales bacterium]